MKKLTPIVMLLSFVFAPVSVSNADDLADMGNLALEAKFDCFIAAFHKDNVALERCCKIYPPERRQSIREGINYARIKVLPIFKTMLEEKIFKYGFLVEDIDVKFDGKVLSNKRLSSTKTSHKVQFDIIGIVHCYNDMTITTTNSSVYETKIEIIDSKPYLVEEKEIKTWSDTNSFGMKD